MLTMDKLRKAKTKQRQLKRRNSPANLLSISFYFSSRFILIISRGYVRRTRSVSICSPVSQKRLHDAWRVPTDPANLEARRRANSTIFGLLNKFCYGKGGLASLVDQSLQSCSDQKKPFSLGIRMRPSLHRLIKACFAMIGLMSLASTSRAIPIGSCGAFGSAPGVSLRVAAASDFAYARAILNRPDVAWSGP